MVAKTSFGQWLKQRRKTLDLTREQLAQSVGCATVTLYKIEIDERRPSQQLAARLAEHLNIPLDERTTFVQFARAKPAESVAPWGTVRADWTIRSEKPGFTSPIISIMRMDVKSSGHRGYAPPV